MAINANFQLITNITIITANICNTSLTIVKTPELKNAAMVSISETTLVTSLPTEFLSK